MWKQLDEHLVLQFSLEVLSLIIFKACCPVNGKEGLRKFCEHNITTLKFQLYYENFRHTKSSKNYSEYMSNHHLDLVILLYVIHLSVELFENNLQVP